MGAGQIEFESINARILAALHNFHPRVLVELLHDRSDEHAARVQVFAFFEFVDPDGKRAVADELDIFPAEDFLAVAGTELCIAWSDVDDLGGIKAYGLGDDRPPPLAECPRNDIQVRAGRAGGYDERIGEAESVNGGG